MMRSLKNNTLRITGATIFAFAALAILPSLQAPAWGAAPAGLFGYWTFDDGTATDSAGDNHGTVFGATPVPGMVDGAMSFGGGDYIQLPEAPVFGSSDFTVTVWARDDQSATGVEGVFSSLMGPPWKQAFVYINSQFYTLLPNSAACVSGAFVRTDWNYIVLRRTGDTFQWFVNGAPSGGACSCAGVWNAANPEYGMRLGSTRNNYMFEDLTGVLDELAFFDRALSDS
ncbi:MAG: LamG-like jellyroll fold domain-containing protein, partial [Elusimicrobiota bacterium]